jgi:hypothetical protein
LSPLELAGCTGANCQHSPAAQQDMEIQMRLAYPIPQMHLCSEYEQDLWSLGFVDCGEQ